MPDGSIRNEVNVQIDVPLGGFEVGRLYTTHHDGGFVAKTVVHQHNFAHRMGGARFVAECDPGGRKVTPTGHALETARLAVAMTEKNALAGLPLDGQKSVITCPHGVPDERERQRVLREHIRRVSALDPGAVWGPDIANGESIMNEVAAEPRDRVHVTGLSETHGGLGIDTYGYTARGLGVALRVAIAQRGLDIRNASVQGAGAVGGHALGELATLGIPVTAINAVSGTLVAKAGGELRVSALMTLLARHGDAGLDAYAAAHPDHASFIPDPAALFDSPADLFIPAARTMTLALRCQLTDVADENPDVRAIEDWYAKTRPKLIGQGANGPITEEGEAWLHERGVLVLPDVAVNCGGLIGCALEWVYREQLLGDPAQRLEIDAIARRFTQRVVSERVQMLLASDENPRVRARQLAIEALAANQTVWHGQPGGISRDRVRSYVTALLETE